MGLHTRLTSCILPQLTNHKKEPRLSRRQQHKSWSWRSWGRVLSTGKIYYRLILVESSSGERLGYLPFNIRESEHIIRSGVLVWIASYWMEVDDCMPLMRVM
ncbi:hypothetical protein AVEN_180286-1 [Araneus ventricosus]|uniref:Uncharacterized protein n=1 Tax=Araneus ventricosus TaxID=182803 RepID=A0A4Y2I086_ARAVE|nr:hypothetical protein AVEN_180286-1 [Araneus ventricosus]